MKEYLVKIKIPCHVFDIQSADGKRKWENRIGRYVDTGETVMLDPSHESVKHWLKIEAIVPAK